MSIVNIPYDFKSDIDAIISSLVSKGWLHDGCGSDHEPYSTTWCKCLDAGFKNKNNYCVIDWGCGYGRFLNYLLLKNVEKIKYYGFELHGKKNGDLLIDFCKNNYLKENNSNRIIKFGYIDDKKLIDEAKNNCNTILLGSVFTHMNINDSINLLKKFDDFIRKGGQVIFSLITQFNKYKEIGAGAYGKSTSFRAVSYSNAELKKLTNNGRYLIKPLINFLTPSSTPNVDRIYHTIYRLKYQKRGKFLL